MRLKLNKYLGVLLFLTACSDWNSEVKIQGDKGIPVISGFFKIGDEPSFSLHETTSPFDTDLRNEKSKLIFFVNNFQNALLYDSLQYSSPNVVNELDTIQLIGSLNSKNFEAQDICPRDLNKGNVQIEKLDETRLKVKLSGSEKEGYYKLEVFETWMDYDVQIGNVYYDSILKVETLDFSSNNIFFENQNFRNDGQKYRIFRLNGGSHDGHSITLSLNSTLEKSVKHKDFYKEIVLRQVSVNYFNFLLSVVQNTYRYGDVLSLPSNAFSNVDNGLGMFCCYSEIRDTIR